MKFISMFCSKERFYTDPGSAIKIEYQLREGKDGFTLYETGQTNLSEYIQSHADSVDIHKILERCAVMDDYSFLNRMPTAFMDVTDMPSTLAEAYAAIKDAENFFERMPVEIKQKYDNSFTDFLKSLGTEKFGSVVMDYMESIKPKDVGGDTDGDQERE